ncbi:MAG: hypothetical protein A2X86_18200 [Bdellovibrionales bacterium GWA2_49_15]|nr:MAG: hypothetical protein A2X86_18200 [Bdellovibrionales bacterium GWA2_49_15]HAZ11656.1 hypothetical protein [Bdellovibrionales bacterium]
MSLPEERFLFYLKLRPELPAFFFPLARLLSGFGVDLVPVNFEDLKNLTALGKSTIILSVCQDLSAYRSLLIGRKYYLDHALLNGKHKLIDATSFSPVSQIVTLQRKNRYFYHKLPITMDDLAREVAIVYYNEYKQAEVWPGGKRTTLPALTG